MKKKNLIATLAIIALSTTAAVALELDTDAMNEMTPEIKATVETEVNAQTREGQEIPDYKSLNQTFINKLEKAAAESKYQTKEECPDCINYMGSEGSFLANTHSSVKEVYDETLKNYKKLLETLDTKTRYNKKDQQEIISLIKMLDTSIKEISSEERYKYVNFICKQDRYFLKAKDSVVNMSFLVSDNEEFRLSYLNCIDEEPLQIKAHTFWEKLSNWSHTSESKAFRNSIPKLDNGK